MSLRSLPADFVVRCLEKIYERTYAYVKREREKGLPISTFLEEAGKGGDLKKLFGQKYGWNSVEVGIDRAC